MAIRQAKNSNNKTFLIFTIITVIFFLFYLFFNYINNKHFHKQQPIKNMVQTTSPALDNEPIESKNEIPLFDLFSNKNMTKHIADIQYVHNSEIIKSDEQNKNSKQSFIRAEDMGDDFSIISNEALFIKLQTGDKIEQRKSANVIWKKFGSSTTDKLSNNEKQIISNSVKKYLLQLSSDFEENFLQIQRLWHLAVSTLLENVTNADVAISENSARLLSLMKTSQIIDQLISQSNNAKSTSELKKYIFALQYMKINNRYFLKNRERMSDAECKKYYYDRVEPQMMLLSQRLERLGK